MKNIKIIEGVVAEFNGKFWGTQYSDGYCTNKDFLSADTGQTYAEFIGIKGH